MTPPPSVSTKFDLPLQDRSSQVAQTSVENTAEISTKRNNILSAISNYQENQMAQSKSDNATALGSNESRIGNMMIEEILEVAGNESPILMQNNFLARNVLFEDLPSDSENIIKILENTIHIKTLLQQQNEFLVQWKNKIIPNNELSRLLTVDGDPNNNNSIIIPKKPFRKYIKLMEYDVSLKNNEEKKRQLETFFYLLGRDSLQEQIKHSLQKIISNKLTMKFSWKGQKGNFAIKSLLLIDIIKNAARKHFPMLTDKEMQNFTSSWLKYAKTRHDREKAKLQAVNNC